MGKGLSGDFIGFTFNGIHSSTLGITRVSNGSRYVEDLLPSYQDKVVEAPGADETFYFGSYYKQKIFNISFAFDNLTETQIRLIKQLFGDKDLHELWFDETPYKAYNVKVSGSPQLKYICFDVEQQNSRFERIYKGEGTVNFIAFYPFAHSRYNYIDDFDLSYGNLNEWANSSNLRIKRNFEKFIRIGIDQRKAALWNAGDIPTDFKLNIEFGDYNKITKGFLKINDEKLVLDSIFKKEKDDGIEINSRLKLIQGYRKVNNKKILTNNIYNQYIVQGDFFKIPLGETTLEIEGLFGQDTEKISIDFKHWYL